MLLANIIFKYHELYLMSFNTKSTNMSSFC